MLCCFGGGLPDEGRDAPSQTRGRARASASGVRADVDGGNTQAPVAAEPIAAEAAASHRLYSNPEYRGSGTVTRETDEVAEVATQGKSLATGAAQASTGPNGPSQHGAEPDGALRARSGAMQSSQQQRSPQDAAKDAAPRADATSRALATNASSSAFAPKAGSPAPGASSHSHPTEASLVDDSKSKVMQWLRLTPNAAECDQNVGSPDAMCSQGPPITGSMSDDSRLHSSVPTQNQSYPLGDGGGSARPARKDEPSSMQRDSHAAAHAAAVAAQYGARNSSQLGRVSRSNSGAQGASNVQTHLSGSLDASMQRTHTGGLLQSAALAAGEASSTTRISRLTPPGPGLHDNSSAMLTNDAESTTQNVDERALSNTMQQLRQSLTGISRGIPAGVSSPMFASRNDHVDGGLFAGPPEGGQGGLLAQLRTNMREQMAVMAVTEDDASSMQSASQLDDTPDQPSAQQPQAPMPRLPVTVSPAHVKHLIMATRDEEVASGSDDSLGVLTGHTEGSRSTVPLRSALPSSEGPKVEQPYVGAPRPDDEELRHKHMCNLNIFDTESEKRYDRLTSFVASVYNVPLTLVSLVDTDRQWFKSIVGLPGVKETDRKTSFCAWTLLPQAPECLVVRQADLDARFKRNPLVTGAPHIRFYAGCPLVSSNGARLGSFCIIDSRYRYFTSEDCNLLCNFAELAVREIEALRAAERRNFGDDNVAPSDALRSTDAWDVGILVLHIHHENWIVRHGNDRAGEILGLSEVDDIIGMNFWEHFAATDSLETDPWEHYQDKLQQGQDFSVDLRCFTDEGRKIRVTAAFRSGALSQLDDECPVIAAPHDLPSEPGTKSGFWFVTLRATVAKPGGGMGSMLAKLASNKAPSGVDRAVSPAALGDEVLIETSQGDMLELAECFRPESLRGFENSVLICQGPHMKVYDVFTRGEKCRLLAAVHFDVDTYQFCEETRAAVHRWQDLGMGEYALTDLVLCDEGSSAALTVRRTNMPVAMTLRRAIHEGIFKIVPSQDEIYNGVVQLDTVLVLHVLLHIANGLAKLHTAGEVFGELSDTTIVMGTTSAKYRSGAQWQFGADCTAKFSMCGSALKFVQRQSLQSFAGTRPDHILFFAPERFEDASFGPTVRSMLVPSADAAADMWAFGVLMAYLCRFSLPVINDLPQTLLQKAIDGTVATEVLDIDTLDFPSQMKSLIKLCLSPSPQTRPTASRCVNALQSMLKKALADSNNGSSHA